jgi:anthrone oxygenase-like protein
MLVKTWRFCALILAALSMAMAFCHLLEMPSRLAWDAPLWIANTVTGNVFRLFGSVGAAIETLAWIAAMALAILIRHRQPTSFRLTVAGAALLVLAFVVWWAFVFPVNVEMASWTPQQFPSDWAAWGAQWEYAHAARAVLLIGGLSALVLSVVVETPVEPVPARRPDWPPG